MYFSQKNNSVIYIESIPYTIYSYGTDNHNEYLSCDNIIWLGYDLFSAGRTCQTNIQALGIK